MMTGSPGGMPSPSHHGASRARATDRPATPTALQTRAGTGCGGCDTTRSPWESWAIGLPESGLEGGVRRDSTAPHLRFMHALDRSPSWQARTRVAVRPASPRPRRTSKPVARPLRRPLSTPSTTRCVPAADRKQPEQGFWLCPCSGERRVSGHRVAPFSLAVAGRAGGLADETGIRTVGFGTLVRLTCGA